MKNNTPAFPTHSGYENNYGQLKAVDANSGMTLRDYFAAKAMQVVLADCKEFPDENWRIGVAMDAYQMADAMMKAREAK